MAKRDAILNIDMDFFTYPIYTGSGYVNQDWSSYSDHQARTKTWLPVQDFVEKMGLSEKQRVRGACCSEDKQILYNIRKIIESKFITPGEFDVIHVDAHHDMFSWHKIDHYNSYGLFSYQNFDSNIALFKEKWSQNMTWIIPDPMTQNELDDQFSFRPEVSSTFINNNYRYTLHYLKDSTIYVDTMKWKDFQNKYNWRYMNLVFNRNMCNHSSEYMEELQKYISLW